MSLRPFRWLPAWLVAQHGQEADGRAQEEDEPKWPPLCLVVHCPGRAADFESELKFDSSIWVAFCALATLIGFLVVVAGGATVESSSDVRDSADEQLLALHSPHSALGARPHQVDASQSNWAGRPASSSAHWACALAPTWPPFASAALAPHGTRWLPLVAPVVVVVVGVLFLPFCFKHNLNFVI